MRDLALEFNQKGHEAVVLVPTQGVHKASILDTVDGVKVYRLSSFRTKDVNYLRRTLGEILFPLTMMYGLWKSKFAFRELDGVVWYSPSIFFGLLVLILKWRSNCKAYLILRDIFPEWMLDLGLMKRGSAYYIFRLFAIFQYKVADTIGVQTKSNINYFSKYIKNKSAWRLEVLQNWLTEAPVSGCSIPLDSTILSGRKIFVYIGNMGIAQGMDILVDLAAEFLDQDDIGFLFVGRGSEVSRLRLRVDEEKLSNIVFNDEIDPREIPGLLSNCCVGLLVLDPRHKSHNIPGKFLTYLQAGLPILARVNPGTDLVNVINEEAVGSVYLGNDVKEFKIIAQNLIDNNVEQSLISERSIQLSRRMFSSETAVKQIATALQLN